MKTTNNQGSSSNWAITSDLQGYYSKSIKEALSTNETFVKDTVFQGDNRYNCASKNKQPS